MLKIFDSLVHSGINPEWPTSPKVSIGINSVLDKLSQESSLVGACIQTSPWFDSSHSNELFISCIRNYVSIKTFVPVYTVPYATSFESIKVKLNEAIDCGFYVFKIHPRFSKLSLSLCIDIIDYLSSSRFLVQVCCYPFQKITEPAMYDFNSIFSGFVNSLCQISNKYSSYICLMHGFGTHILDIHNIVRHNNFLLLDLSMTIMKYAGSSLDMDLHFLFNSFDRRIILGSDYPEWPYPNFVARVLLFSEGINSEKSANIAHNNLLCALHHGSNSAL